MRERGSSPYDASGRKPERDRIQPCVFPCCRARSPHMLSEPWACPEHPMALQSCSLAPQNSKLPVYNVEGVEDESRIELPPEPKDTRDGRVPPEEPPNEEIRELDTRTRAVPVGPSSAPFSFSSRFNARAVASKFLYIFTGRPEKTVEERLNDLEARVSALEAGP